MEFVLYARIYCPVGWHNMLGICDARIANDNFNLFAGFNCPEDLRTVAVGQGFGDNFLSLLNESAGARLGIMHIHLAG